jgi:hypothetical protein
MSDMAQHPPAGHGHGQGDDDDEPALLRKASLGEVEPPPDFLAGVQAKLHARSGGKFYRSQWSRSRLATTTQIISLLMLLVILLIWLFAGPVKDLGPDREAAGQGDESGEVVRPPVKIRSQAQPRAEPPAPPP